MPVGMPSRVVMDQKALCLDNSHRIWSGPMYTAPVFKRY